jgi:hypothetical protein
MWLGPPPYPDTSEAYRATQSLDRRPTMEDLTPLQAHALLVLSHKVGRTGLSKATTSHVREALQLATHPDVMLVLEDLEDLGLVEKQTNGAWLITESGMACGFLLDKDPATRNLTRARTRRPSDLPEPSGSPGSASSALPCAAEPNSSVKSSPRSRAEGTESPHEPQVPEGPQVTYIGESDRIIRRVANPLTNALTLARWFSGEVEWVLSAHGVVRLRPVLTEPLAKHIKEWTRHPDVDLPLVQAMMSVFLDQPERWFRVERPAWRVFLSMKDELLKRVQRVDSEAKRDEWEAWQIETLGVATENSEEPDND